MSKRMLIVLGVLVGLVLPMASPASASHSWASYHWSRTSNPVTVLYGDNVDSRWDAYLDEAISDWNASSVVEMTEAAGTVTNLKKCSAPVGRVEVCNSRYGFSGWLGVAGIWVSGGHIVSGYTKLNDSYFDTSTYNKPEWRRLVTCQEIAHNVGLGHQDEDFDNANLGSCMDYTDVPLGPPSNEHPNQHDFDQLQTIYGGHLDSTQSTSSGPKSRGNSSAIVTVDGNGSGSVIHVFWAPSAPQGVQAH